METSRPLGTAILLGATAVGVAVAAGVTLPFSGADGNTISGCYSTGGALKLRTPAEPTCPKGYTPINWNATGPTGAQGIQGIKGQQEIQGVQGIPGPAATIASFRTFTVDVNEEIDIYGTGRAQATCPAGSLLTGGGVYLIDAELIYSYQSGNTWNASADAGIFGGQVGAIATCMTDS